MSKSVGNVVEAFQLTDKYGHDAFRYFLLREMNFGLDASFSEEALVDRLNADLANDLGNLASRATTLIARRGGAVAQVTAPVEARGPRDRRCAAAERAAPRRARRWRTSRSRRRSAAIWSFIGSVNRYVDTSAPVGPGQGSRQAARLERVLCTLADSLGFLGIVLDPFLPDAARKIREALGRSAAPALEGGGGGSPDRGAAGDQDLRPLPPRRHQGPRPGASPLRGEGRVRGRRARPAPARSRSPTSRRWICAWPRCSRPSGCRSPRSSSSSTIRVGEETRTLVAGVAEHYEPGDLVGRKVVIVANLQPATLMGVESNGMVLAAEHEGTLSLLTLDKDLPSGAKVK